MFLDPRLLVVLAQLFMFADSKGLDVTITSIKSGREHLETISQTHEEYRAIDVRSKNWPEKYKLAVVKKLNREMGHLGAIGFFTGERKVIIFEKNAKYGEHFHIQVSKLIRKTGGYYVRKRKFTKRERVKRTIKKISSIRHISKGK